MKTLKQLTIFILSISLLITCKSDDEFIEDTNEPTGEFTTVDIKVILPEGSSLDLTQTTLFSSLEEFSVSSNGDTEAIHNQNGRSLVMLLDEEKNPILMGFITDTKKEVSVKTTLEAVYYFGLGTIYLPEEIRERYFNESDQLSNLEEFTTETNTMFNANVNFLNSETFKTALKERIDAIRYDADTTDIRNQRIQVDTRDIKSGMNIEEVDFESVLIVNEWRRRGHAFLYKTAFKNEAGDETIIINNIASENSSPKFDIKVSPTKAVRGVVGTLQDVAGGEGMLVVRTTTDPIKLELKEEELESTYQLRVVGPTLTPGALTDIEEAKLRQLEWETLGYDIVLPLLLDIAGHAKALKGLDETKFKPYINALVAFAGSISAVNEPLNAGEYKKALNALFSNMLNSARSSEVEPMLKALIDGILLSAENLGSDYFVPHSDRIINGVENFLNALKAADVFLKFVDYSRIFSALADAKMVEQWEVKAQQTKVTLSPPENIAFPFILEPLNAKIFDTQLSAGQFFEYKWSTTGNYGILKDDVGHASSSFSNTSTEGEREVFYFSEENEEDLPEDAVDKVFVEVLIKQTGQPDKSVGKDTVTVFVKAFKYEINPNGATIEGGTNLTLYIEKPDKSDNITTNPALDFKIVWTTEGKYGLFAGVATESTVYNTNDIGYYCLDKDIENGSETVKARIYGKLKEEGDGEYKLYDEVEAVINIENDDKKRTYIVPVSVGHVPIPNPLTPDWTMSYSYVGVPVDPDAIRYEVEVLEHFWGYNGTNMSFSGISWTNDSFANFLEQNPNEYQTRLAVATYSASNPSAGVIQGRYGSISGYAQVTIYFE